MTVTAVQDALPAEFVTALTQVTDAAQVTVDRYEPKAWRTDAHVWVKPPEIVEEREGGVAEPEWGWPFGVEIRKRGGDDDDVEEFMSETLVHFQGKRRPSVAGLRRMELTNAFADYVGGKAGYVALRTTLWAVTREATSDGDDGAEDPTPPGPGR